MIRPVKLKTSVALLAFSSLLCGLLISGCSSGQTEAQRTAFKPYSRRPRRSSDTSAEARSSSSSNRMFQSPVQPASAPDVLLAQKVIRDHLHAFGRSDFHLAYNLLTPGFQQGVGSEESLRRMMEGFYSDFMHVKKVDWQGFSKNEESGDIKARLTFEASSGGVTRATYILQRQDGRYLIGGIDSYSPSQFNGGSGPRGNRPNEVEEKMFSGVLYSPAPRHRVLDASPTSF